MATKRDMSNWLRDALRDLGGAAHHVRVAEHIWRDHEEDLRDSGDLFYTWQYDLRWVAQNLRDEGVLMPVVKRQDGIWRLKQ